MPSDQFPYHRFPFREGGDNPSRSQGASGTSFLGQHRARNDRYQRAVEYFQGLHHSGPSPIDHRQEPQYPQTAKMRQRVDEYKQFNPAWTTEAASQRIYQNEFTSDEQKQYDQEQLAKGAIAGPSIPRPYTASGFHAVTDYYPPTSSADGARERPLRPGSVSSHRPQLSSRYYASPLHQTNYPTGDSSSLTGAVTSSADASSSSQSKGKESASSSQRVTAQDLRSQQYRGIRENILNKATMRGRADIRNPRYQATDRQIEAGIAWFDELKTAEGGVKRFKTVVESAPKEIKQFFLSGRTGPMIQAMYLGVKPVIFDLTHEIQYDTGKGSDTVQLIYQQIKEHIIRKEGTSGDIRFIDLTNKKYTWEDDLKEGDYAIYSYSSTKKLFNKHSDIFGSDTSENSIISIITQNMRRRGTAMSYGLLCGYPRHAVENYCQRPREELSSIPIQLLGRGYFNRSGDNRDDNAQKKDNALYRDSGMKGLIWQLSQENR